MSHVGHQSAASLHTTDERDGEHGTARCRCQRQPLPREAAATSRRHASAIDGQTERQDLACKLIREGSPARLFLLAGWASRDMGVQGRLLRAQRVETKVIEI
jgi:hypothetical protein